MDEDAKTRAALNEMKLISSQSNRWEERLT